MNQGYIGLFRKFFNEHEFWRERRKYSKAEAWIDLMQSARYGEEPETLFDKRGAYVLEYGDVYISLRYLGERWQWSKNKVRGFLDYLEKRESISFKKKDSHRTIINIINLKGYIEWIKGKRDSEGTVKGQSGDSEGTKKKKVKKEENIIKDIVLHLNEKTEKNFKCSTDKTTSFINARINDGFSLDDFKKVIDRKVLAWKNDVNMNKYLRPETLFGNKFEGYLNECGEVEELIEYKDTETGETEMLTKSQINERIPGAYPETQT